LLAYKAEEIEELADVYFFRPLGMVVARVAGALSMTPIAVTCVGMALGAMGGWLLHDARSSYAGFALIIVHSIFDSADGQLARMTGRVSELGRVLDGVGGYVTHVAVYVALLVRLWPAGGHPTLLLWVLAAALANIVHAQMYDYHRSAYARCAIKGRPRPEGTASSSEYVSAVLRGYEAIQRRLSGRHPDVEQAMALRAVNGVARDDDRARYRESFYWPVRGWNFFGDNTRFYALGAVAWLERPDWFFTFVLVPMNVAFAGVWLWQQSSDRRFLAGV
jgi:hypothetical protein